MRRRRSGVSLIEVLIGLLIVTIASIATLNYFASGFGSINKQGNRRAALEQTRARLEQLMASTVSELPPQSGNCYYCAAAACTAASWIAYACGTVPPADTVPQVGRLTNLRRETTAQFINDPSANTATLDVYTLGVKVWFTPGATNDNFNRVYVKSLRTP